VPPDLVSATSQIEYEAITLLRSGRYEEAESRYRELLARFLEWEKDHGLRIHKGGPFHNLALSLLYQGKSVEALRFLLFAYIEDSIGSDNPGECDSSPASRVLRGLGGVGQDQLRKIDEVVFRTRTDERLLKDPMLHEVIFSEADDIVQAIIGNYEKYLSNTWKIDIEGQRLLQNKAFATAFKAYQDWFNILLEYQNVVSMRIHKGTPLFNMGLSLFLRGDEESKLLSKEWFLYALIENALSAASINDIYSEQSFMILKSQLGIDDETLRSLAEFALSQKNNPASSNPKEVVILYVESNNIRVVTSILAQLPSMKKKKKLHLYENALLEKDPNKKGQILVDLMSLIIETDSNFSMGKVDVRTESEQIDLEIHNKALDPFLRQLDSMIIIVECKNWSKNVGSDEIRDFAGKVANRPRVLCNVGLFITTSEFTEPAVKELLRHSGKDYLVATMDGNDLKQAVSDCLPFSEILKKSILSAGRR
jgi:tetratricopeptide (TPR) repeat protein